MRLSHTPAAGCLATLCLATITTTTTRAFFVPAASLRTVGPLSSGLAGARCNASPIPTIMKVENEGGSKGVVALRDATANLFFRRRGGRSDGEAFTPPDADQEGELVVGKKRRDRGLVRKSVAAVATAVVVRSSFQPKPASAIMFKLRGPSAAQQTVERQKQEAMRQELLAEDDDVAAFERELAGEVESDAPAGVEGAGAVAGGLLETGEENGSGTAAMETSEDAAEESAADKKARAAKMRVKERAAKLKSEVGAKDFNPNTIEVATGRLKTYGFAIVGVIATYNAVSSYSGSTGIMGRQRRRVKVESAKFDQQKDEFMDVEGEVEVDVDMMKELRDLKETMAGPGDKYAKDTRKYNPEFAAANPEEDYDSKLDEVLGRTKKDSDDKPTFGKTGIVFSREESKGPKRTPAPSSSKDDAKADDLLGDNGSNTAASAESKGEGEGEGDGGATAAAAAAIQAKKDADVKRLSELFNSSPSEDDDSDASPEDDLGDDRELLP